MTASLDIDPDSTPTELDQRRPHGHADPTDLERFRIDRLTAARQRREAARVRDLVVLLRGRPELEGVHALADFAVTSVRWCV